MVVSGRVIYLGTSLRQLQDLSHLLENWTESNGTKIYLVWNEIESKWGKAFLKGQCGNQQNQSKTWASHLRPATARQVKMIPWVKLSLCETVCFEKRIVIERSCLCRGTPLLIVFQCGIWLTSWGWYIANPKIYKVSCIPRVVSWIVHLPSTSIFNSAVPKKHLKHDENQLQKEPSRSLPWKLTGFST